MVQPVHRPQASSAPPASAIASTASAITTIAPPANNPHHARTCRVRAECWHTVRATPSCSPSQQDRSGSPARRPPRIQRRRECAERARPVLCPSASRTFGSVTSMGWRTGRRTCWLMSSRPRAAAVDLLVAGQRISQRAEVVQRQRGMLGHGREPVDVGEPVQQTEAAGTLTASGAPRPITQYHEAGYDAQSRAAHGGPSSANRRPAERSRRRRRSRSTRPSSAARICRRCSSSSASCPFT